MNESNNQRDSERLPADYRLEYRVPDSGIEGTGQIRDLSQTGAQFVAVQGLEPGAAISLRIPALKDGLPPMVVAGEIVRCVEEPDGTYSVACAFD